MKNLERKSGLSCVRSEKASSNYLMQAPYFIYAVMHASMTGGNTYIVWTIQGAVSTNWP